MIALIAILIIYGTFLCVFAGGFVAYKKQETVGNDVSLKVSIIVCARNEAAQIRECLLGIVSQQYPKHLMEIVFVDDAGSDNTLQYTKDILTNSGIKYQIICNQMQLGKKKSLANAIALTTHDFIITRDADTHSRSALWLMSIAQLQQQKQSDLIIGPLALKNSFGLLWALQAIENNILQVMAAGSAFFGKAFLCSGANLAFSKNIYQKCGGYHSHIHLASGDDVFLLEDVKKIPGARIHYLKSTPSIIDTYACNNLKSLVSQKIRWASKFKHNQNPINLALAGVTFMVNLAWVICCLAIFVKSSPPPLAGWFVLIKLCLDFLILFVASSFIKNKNIAVYALPVLCMYPIYAMVIALASIFIQPRWK